MTTPATRRPLNNQPLQHATAITIHVTCPHCEFSTPIPADPNAQPLRDGFGFDTVTSSYVCTCDSCGERFDVPDELGHDVQHAGLIILGED